ncbi:MAG: hypothetical protein JW852_01210 [Spirochaetales bacterium]|nr:hypothetical protein [Spirochaetales bacterium]
MKKNVLREMLNAGKPTIGTHVISPWPGIIEIIGKSGAFDYIEYVGEYSPFSIDGLENIGRTFELFPEMSSMMKVEEQTRGFIASRSIDAGIQNVLFTDVRSAAEAKECVRCVRAESPEQGGTHGVSMRRGPDYYVYGSLQQWVKAMKDVVIAFMIEKKGAMENLDAILDVEGVDMVQFGPADYSVSMGMADRMQSAEVQNAQKEMVKKALAKGVHPRVEIGGYEEAKPWLDLGVRHFCIGWDIVTIAAWCTEQAEGMKKLLG